MKKTLLIGLICLCSLSAARAEHYYYAGNGMYIWVWHWKDVMELGFGMRYSIDTWNVYMSAVNGQKAEMTDLSGSQSGSNIYLSSYGVTVATINNNGQSITISGFTIPACSEETYNNRPASAKNASATGTASSMMQYGGSSSTSTSSSTSSQMCQFCHGSGRCEWAGAYADQYCHGSGTCSKCNGRLWLYNSYTCKYDVPCNYCNQTGRCGKCGGSGKCKHCNGTGRQ